MMHGQKNIKLCDAKLILMMELDKTYEHSKGIKLQRDATCSTNTQA